jgi:hypothetical protein
MPFEPFKRDRDGAKAFLERMRNGASNNEILAELLDKESNTFTDHVYELPKGQMTKARLPDVAKYKLQLHAFFSKPDPNADYSGHSSVYLVGQPNRWARRLSRTPKPSHWSIYSEGHFYHLKLEDGAQGSSIVLRDEPQRVENSRWPFYCIPHRRHRLLSRRNLSACKVGDHTDESRYPLYGSL